MTETLTDAPVYPMSRGGCPFDPPPELNQRTREQPIFRVTLWDGSVAWLITRYEDVRTMLSDPRASADYTLDGYPHPTQGNKARPKHTRSFINMDDPEHAAQRRLLTSDFMVKKMEALRPRIQEIVDGLIDDMLAGPKPVDLVQAFALPLPSRIICELLGVPYADHEFFHRLSAKIISRDTAPEEFTTANNELAAYLTSLVEKKNREPADDLLSRLAVGQLRTGAMTSTKIGAMGLLLLVAGHETTANMIALGTTALLEHPDQLAEVRGSDDPKLIANTVEELLRYLTIVHVGRRRVAIEDFEIGGQLIRKGEGIIGATEVANRDATVFPDPDALDVHRKARHHIAFGYGIHQCLGQPLARVELQVVYSTLYRRIPTLALAIPLEDVDFKHNMVVYGVHSLPVTW